MSADANNSKDQGGSNSDGSAQSYGAAVEAYERLVSRLQALWRGAARNEESIDSAGPSQPGRVISQQLILKRVEELVRELGEEEQPPVEATEEPPRPAVNNDEAVRPATANYEVLQSKFKSILASFLSSPEANADLARKELQNFILDNSRDEEALRRIVVLIHSKVLEGETNGAKIARLCRTTPQRLKTRTLTRRVLEEHEDVFTKDVRKATLPIDKDPSQKSPEYESWKAKAVLGVKFVIYLCERQAISEEEIYTVSRHYLGCCCIINLECLGMLLPMLTTSFRVNDVRASLRRISEDSELPQSVHDLALELLTRLNRVA